MPSTLRRRLFTGHCYQALKKNDHKDLYIRGQAHSVGCKDAYFPGLREWLDEHGIRYYVLSRVRRGCKITGAHSCLVIGARGYVFSI
jgi:hypothetical protein